MNPGATIQLNYKLQRESFALDIDTELPMHGITAVFGPSGAGKTTLLRCIAGLEDAATSRLVVAGDTWEDSSAGSSRSVHERNIGYVFQEPRLFDHLSVRANIEYGQRRRNHNNGPGIDQVIELLGLQQLLARSPSELSGGEAQRVAIARALLCSPRFVLMDEPLASLDQARRDEILPFLDRLHVESQVPIIYVSHNIDEVCRLCDHLVVIESGRVVADGELQDVLVRMDIPALGGDQSGSVIEGIAREHDAGDDLTRLAFSGGDLWVPGRAAEEESSLRLRIRASDVSLCRSMPEQSTILNILPVVVEAIQPGDGPSMLVRLKLGDDRIVARVTRRSIRELGLQVSDQVFAQIKSVAVRSFCIPRNAVNYL
jgi:molybdate transport system ATP-binding protein